MSTLAIRLDDRVARELDEIARASGRSAVELAGEAIADMLAREQSQRARVEAGIAAADAGDLVEHEALFERIDARIRARMAGDAAA